MMNAEPLVSVCMTAYNHAPYIGRAIEGVLPDGEHDRVFPPASGPVAGGTERKLRFFLRLR